LKHFESSILNEKSFVHLIFIDTSHMYVCRCVIEAAVFHMCKENIKKKKKQFHHTKRDKKGKKRDCERKRTKVHVVARVTRSPAS